MAMAGNLVMLAVLFAAAYVREMIPVASAVYMLLPLFLCLDREPSDPADIRQFPQSVLLYELRCRPDRDTAFPE